MKTLRFFASMLLAMALGFSFASCDKDDDVDTSKIEGKWYATRLEGSVKYADNPDRNTAWDDSIVKGDYFIDFKTDKKVEIGTLEDGAMAIEHGTWSLSGDKLAIHIDETDPQPYEYEINARVKKLSKDKLEFESSEIATDEAYGPYVSRQFFYMVK